MTVSGIRLTPLYAAALALVLPASAMAADEASKPYKCGDGREMKVFQPEDGMMTARVDDLTVRITVRDGTETAPASYDVRVFKGEDQVKKASATTVGDTLSKACNRIEQYYEAVDRARKGPSAEKLRKQLFEYYDGL